MKMKDLKKLLEKYDDDVEVLGITIDKSLVDDGEFVYVAWNEANKYGKLHKVTILWTCSESNLKQLKNSILKEI